MINDIIEIKIVKLNINFEGIGFYNNKKVCVKNVLPNEVVRAKIVYEKESFISAILVKIIVKNPLRIKPKCKYYNYCGGCHLQILEPLEALKLKGSVIKDYFNELFYGEILINKSDNVFNYRNKVSFSVKNNLIIGLKKDNSNEIVNIDECIISNEIINKVLIVLKTFLQEKKIDVQIKYFVVREFDGCFILTIVVKDKLLYIDDFDLLVEKLKANFRKNTFGIFINHNLSKNEIFGNNWQHIYGLSSLNIKLNCLDINVHPYSFLQVNYNVAQKLYNRVVNFVENKDIVIEGYSGAGILSALMASKAKEVYSIEINKKATSDANLLKKKNKILNLHNINGSCLNVIPELNVNFKESIFVLDPPQSGCDKKILDTIIQKRIKKIIYISCNPYTLKQNIYYLKEFYDIKNLEIFDMFPNTAHIECLCVLNLKQ